MRILGLTTAHDSSICVLNNGQIEYFSKEELKKFEDYSKNILSIPF